MRNNVKPEQAAIQWVEFGLPSFCAYTPFFANADDTDVSYRKFPAKMKLKNAYWLNEALAMVVESHYSEFYDQDETFQKGLNEWAWQKIATVDAKADQLSGAKLTTYLTGQNHKIAKHYNKKAKRLPFDLMTQETEFSKLTFKMDPNL